MSTELRIAEIRTDGGTQMRSQLDLATIAEYTDALERGDLFPAVVVFYDGAAYWLAEGFHRLAAHRNLARETIAAEVKPGTREDAVVAACAANATHGLRRTNADKRNAVETMLRLRPAMSDRQIAEHCGVHHDMVSEARARLVASGGIRQIENRTVTRGGTTYQQDTANIGKRTAEPAPKPAPTYAPVTTWEALADEATEPEEEDEPAEDTYTAPPTAPAPIRRAYAPYVPIEPIEPEDDYTPPVPLPLTSARPGLSLPADLERARVEAEQASPSAHAMPFISALTKLSACVLVEDAAIEAWAGVTPQHDWHHAEYTLRRIGEWAAHAESVIQAHKQQTLRVVKG